MDEDELKDSDFKKMWERESNELHDLCYKGVPAISTELLTGYRALIWASALHDRHIATLEAKLKTVGVN